MSISIESQKCLSGGKNTIFALSISVPGSMQSLKPIFKDTSIGFQLFLFVGLLVFGAIIGMLTGLVMNKLIGNSPYSDLISGSANILSLQSARILQLSTQIGLFLFPPFFLGYLVDAKPIAFLGFHKIKRPEIFLPAVLLMFASLPLVHLLSDLNNLIQLPDWLSGMESWMQEKEKQAEEMTNMFLSVSNISGLLFNLLMIALVPALGEELVFRSVVQPYLIRLMPNKHLALLSTAIIFSFIHLQFYGFLPRLMLGLFLGYFYYWSGSIWVPVVMHFFNNAAAVIAYYLHYNGLTDIPMDKFGTSSGIVYPVLSIIVVLILLIYGRRTSQT